MATREDFEIRLRADRYDEVTHKIFADWLEEHGFDDEASFHRRWTREWQQSYDWMEAFARDVVTEYEEYRQGPVTVEEVLQVTRVYLKDGTQCCLSGLGFGATNYFVDESAIDEFWRHVEVLEGVELGVQEKVGVPFECCI